MGWFVDCEIFQNLFEKKRTKIIWGFKFLLETWNFDLVQDSMKIMNCLVSIRSNKLYRFVIAKNFIKIKKVESAKAIKLEFQKKSSKVLKFTQYTVKTIKKRSKTEY